MNVRQTNKILLWCIIIAWAIILVAGVFVYQARGKDSNEPSKEELYKALKVDKVIKVRPVTDPTQEMHQRLVYWCIKNGATEDIATRIVEAVRWYDHDLLLLAVACVESNFRENLSYLGNYGLLQINRVHLNSSEVNRLKNNVYTSDIVSTCGVEKEEDLFNVEKNVCSANVILNRLFYRKGISKTNLEQTLLEYNAHPEYKEKYTKKVINTYKDLLAFSGNLDRYGVIQYSNNYFNNRN